MRRTPTTPDPSATPARWRAAAAAFGAAALTLLLVGCSSAGTPTGRADAAAPTASAGMAGMDHGTMPGTATGAPAGNAGLAGAEDGYRFVPAVRELPAGRPTRFAFTVIGPDGKPVTGFALHQTKRLHLFAVRSDLTGFQHVHPTMAPDGTWTAALGALSPGTWRTYVTFMPDGGPERHKEFVLSRTLSVPGAARALPLPAAADHAEVDGYTVRVRGDAKADRATLLTVAISKGGKPVTELEPYLDSYAHLTAFHEGDQAAAHFHPANPVTAAGAGPDLPVHALLPRTGRWRLFLQFQTGGRLHTAALTLHVT
ncbi:hypothetical protein [Streptomyces sp. NPDC089919]|uniref:hypothetical protein n=1 Tax=Streptomyces sp. NPDC089919 TaxID=3155188 RepID=UPI00342E8AB1